MIAVRNLTRGTTVAGKVATAESFWQRLTGLLARPPLAEGDGLLICPCRAVHTWFMPYPIDVVFVDSTWRVQAVVENMRPYHLSPMVRKAEMVLELPAGAIRRSATRVQDALQPGEAG